jgi:hypothetical protein
LTISVSRYCGRLLLGLVLLATSARAEVPLVEVGGWTFFADGRVNTFVSTGFGDGFPETVPSPRIPDIDPATGMQRTDPTTGAPLTTDARPSYNIYGSGAGWTVKGGPLEKDGSLFTMRARSGFVGSIFGFGVRKNLTAHTIAKGYVGLWSVVEAPNRDKAATYTTDVRQGYVSFDGPWGGLLAGRDLGLYGRLSTETDFLYGHGYGLGLPCMDVGGNPSCGHVGTGVMGAGFGAAFVYSTPVLAGFQLKAGLYDPVRILGGWDRAALLRPEGQLAFETKFGETGFVKLAAEGIWQQLKLGTNISPDELAKIPDQETSIWGVAGGGRFEYGPVRLGVSGFHGRGLGFFTALQNDPSMFNLVTRELRTFTGYYAQSALVFGPVQLSLGAGTAIADQLETDKNVCNQTLCEPARFSVLRSQTGVSAGVFYSLSKNLVIGVDYFRFMMRWYGARNSHYRLNADGSKALYPDGSEIIDLDPGVIQADELDMNYVNAGVTFHW